MADPLNDIAPEDVRSVLDYEPETGVFRWRFRDDNPAFSRRHAGKVAGSIARNGYVEIPINGKQRRAHRLAFLVMAGYLPTSDIDHIDGDRRNNAWRNLRLATRAQNLWNMRSKASSGFKGVRYHARAKRWVAEIRKGKGPRYIGLFDTPEEAHAAYCAAAQQRDAEFWRAY